MRRWSLAIALCSLSLALVGCGAPSASGPKQGTSPVQHAGITIAGHERTYRLFRPAALPTGPVPLVFNLHPCVAGQTVNGDAQASVTHFDDEAIAGGFVAVYPDGLQGCWNAGRDASGPDDIAFIGQLLDRLVKQLPIDQRRVFVTGVSGGAEMAYRLACDLATRITAIASVSGTLSGDCNPTRPVSILEMHGTDDSSYPWTGGGPGNSPSVGAVIQRWTMLDGCSGIPENSQSGITKTSESRQCKAGAVVRLDTIVGGHHTWFGCAQCDPVAGEPNANAVVWSFFKSLG